MWRAHCRRAHSCLAAQVTLTLRQDRHGLLRSASATRGTEPVPLCRKPAACRRRTTGDHTAVFRQNATPCLPGQAACFRPNGMGTSMRMTTSLQRPLDEAREPAGTDGMGVGPPVAAAGSAECLSLWRTSHFIVCLAIISVKYKASFRSNRTSFRTFSSCSTALLTLDKSLALFTGAGLCQQLTWPVGHVQRFLHTPRHSEHLSAQLPPRHSQVVHQSVTFH